MKKKKTKNSFIEIITPFPFFSDCLKKNKLKHKENLHLFY